MKTLTKRRLRALGIVTCVGIAVIITVWDVPTTFDISAQTDVLFDHVGDFSPVQWTLTDISIFEGYSTTPTKFTGLFNLGKNVDVIIQRTAFGPLRIRCESTTGSVGELEDTDHSNPRDLGQRVVFVVSDFQRRSNEGQITILPLVGDVEFGKAISFDGQNDLGILRAGSIHILGKSLIGSGLFDAGIYNLQMGDDLTFDRSLGFGFVVVDDQPGMKASLRIKSKGASITRFASSGYKITTSLYSRIKGDSALQILWAAVITAMAFAKSLWKEEKKP